MRQFPGLRRAGTADGRKIRSMMIVVAMALAVEGRPAEAGAIRTSAAQARAILKIQKADPNSQYWVRALEHHTLKLRGPRINRVAALNADGTVSETAFVRYMLWRESLSPKRFDSFHPDLAQIFGHVRPSTIPIQSPDFTPVEPGFVTPPTIPEPSTIAIALAMVLAVGIARRGRGNAPNFDLADRVLNAGRARR